MTEIWLVRHGQTDGNLHNIVQGQRNIPLNATGIEQARALADQLVDISFTAVYSSDLSRAMQTATIIAERKGLKVIPDARLREIRQGVWEGLPFEQVIKDFRPDFSPNPVYITTPRAEGAESVAEVLARMVEAANETLTRHPAGGCCFARTGWLQPRCIASPGASPWRMWVSIFLRTVNRW